MSEQINPPAPHYVICHCQHCNGNIEFNANDLVEENSIVPCPHCNVETKIYLPETKLPSPASPPIAKRREGFFCGNIVFEIKGSSKERTSSESFQNSKSSRSPEQIAYLKSVGVPDADKLDDPNHPWRHQPASPKQVAYLTYMGVSNAAQLTKKEAADMIDANPFLDGANSMTAIDRIRSRQARWHEERLKLYPDIYAFELKEYLHEDLPKSLHAFIRQHMVGASEILTKRKIQEVIAALTREDARWWHQSNYQTIFFERLRQAHPGCCDGRAPEY